MAKRFQTYFGIPIPPFKEKKLGAGSTSIRFVLTGKIPSKKNNQQAVSIRSDAKSFIFSTNKKKRGKITIDDAIKAINMVKSKMRGNDEYRDYLNWCKPIIEAQKNEWRARLKDKGLKFPLISASMTLRLYFKDKYVTDTVNKQQTIQDLLIECGVIANDDYKSLNPIHSASACYFDELIYNIAFISLTFRL